MERIKVEHFTAAGNPAVVRLPGRRFPGVVIQGDSLSVLRSDVAEIRAACARGDADEALESADLLLADLDEILAAYSDALARHGIPRPF